MRSIFTKFLKFAVVGVANTAIDWAIFFFLVGVFPSSAGFEVTAKAVAFLAAVLNSLVFNNLWTFRQEIERDRSVGVGPWGVSRVLRFFTTSVGGLFVNVAAFSFARSASAALPDTHSRFISLAAATALSLVWNFAINLKWTYGKRGKRGKRSYWDKLAAFVVAVAFFLAAISSTFDSVTTDEVAHIGAGYQYLTSGKMYLNLEHPPLAKILSTIPLTFLDLDVPPLSSVAQEDADLSRQYWETQWNFGYKVLFGQEVTHRLLLFLVRLPLIGIFAAAAWFLFLLGKRLFGPKAGFISMLVFVLSPSFLAHGRLVTTDVGATLGLISTLYLFHRFLKGESGLVITSLALAASNLLKFSMLVLYPILFVLAVVYFLVDRRKGIWESLRGALVSFIPVAFLGFLATIGFYYLAFPKDVFSPADAQLDALTVNNYYHLFPPLLDISHIGILRPAANYLAGVASVLNRIGGRISLLMMGRLFEGGSPLFFPLSFAFKEPLSLVVTVLLAAASAALVLIRRKVPRGNLFSLLFIAVPFLIYGTLAARTRFDLGIRHVLPALAVSYLFVGWFSLRFWRKCRERLVAGLVGAWIFASFVAAFPNPLAYFNELQFTTRLSKHEIFVDSNLDWGQNLVRLADFVEREGIEEIAVDYWYPLSVVSEYVPQAVGYGEIADWAAVSATSYEISGFREDDPYEALRELEPDVIIGDGMLLFKTK